MSPRYPLARYRVRGVFRYARPAKRPPTARRSGGACGSAFAPNGFRWSPSAPRSSARSAAAGVASLPPLRLRRGAPARSAAAPPPPTIAPPVAYGKGRARYRGACGALCLAVGAALWSRPAGAVVVVALGSPPPPLPAVAVPSLCSTRGGPHRGARGKAPRGSRGVRLRAPLFPRSMGAVAPPPE